MMNEEKDLYIIFEFDFKSLQKEFGVTKSLNNNEKIIQYIKKNIYSLSDANDFKKYGDKKEAEKKIMIHDKKMIVKTYEHQKEVKSDCWWCCHSFNNLPVFIPTAYKNDKFDNHGFFCSFNCALVYNYNNSDSSEYIKRESLIYLLYKKTNGIDFSKNIKIKYAPKKELLKKFGGVIDIDMFRKNNKTFNILYPPMTNIIPNFEDYNLFNNNEEDIMECISNSNNGHNKKKTVAVEEKVQRKITLDNFF